MVVGRLNRESNPVPGEKPGFKPQHKLPDGSFIDTGENNPLPTNLTQIQVAYDGASDSVKSRVMNALEVLESDAFQSSETIFEYASRIGNPTPVVLTPPKGAKGFICEMYIMAANAELVAGQGARINIIGATNQNMDIGGLQFVGEYLKTSYARQTVIWYPNASMGDLRNDVGTFETYTVPIPTPRQMTFNMDIVPTDTGGGVNIGMSVGWLT